MNEPRFGTAGLADSYTVKKFDPAAIAAYTAGFGLTAFEYQCGHGVRLGLDKARQMADDAAARGILFSVHAPYYISASSLDEEKRLNSVNYLLQSAALCRALGGRRVIFHSGSCGRQSREAALEKALDTLKRAQDALDEAGFAEITLCPETMGKIGQLGTLEEVLALCGVDKRISQMTWEELSGYKLTGSQEGVPLFSQMLEAVGGRTPLIIELKGYNDPALLCRLAMEELQGYQGLYCVESFDPRIVRWFKLHHPEIVRGQLMEKMKAGDNGLSGAQAFFARNMMTNFLTRPHFEAYDFHARDIPSLYAARRVFGMQEVSWTIRTQEDYKKAKALGYDAIHDTVHEMAKDEARHGAGFQGLYNRYFKK